MVAKHFARSRDYVGRDRQVIQIRAVLSLDAVTTLVQSALKVALLMSSACFQAPPIGTPVAASQICAVSPDTVTIRLPSGLNNALVTSPMCWKGLPIGSPVDASHIRAVPSRDAVEHQGAIGAERRAGRQRVRVPWVCRSARLSRHSTPARPIRSPLPAATPDAGDDTRAIGAGMMHS